MVATLPGPYNTYVRDHESSGKLVVDFSRNVKKFAINSYAQIAPVKKQTGLYLKMTVEEAGRIVNSDLANFKWPDGAPRPRGRESSEYHQWLSYITQRYSFPTTLGDLTTEQASWDIKSQYNRILGQKAMTGRTVLGIAKLVDTTLYDATHTSAVASIPGNTGNWAASTTARQDIKRSLATAANIIMLDTLSAIDVNELLLVINPTLAKNMALAQEIVDHIKGSPDALAQIRGELPGRNAIHGLPDKLYGYPIVVEDAAKVTTRKGATTSRSFVMSDTVAVLCARPGGLIGVADAPSFSTLTCFMKEEMTVEMFHEDEDRLTNAYVAEDYDFEVTAPASGYVFTSCA